MTTTFLCKECYGEVSCDDDCDSAIHLCKNHTPLSNIVVVKRRSETIPEWIRALHRFVYWRRAWLHWRFGQRFGFKAPPYRQCPCGMREYHSGTCANTLFLA